MKGPITSVATFVAKPLGATGRSCPRVRESPSPVTIAQRRTTPARRSRTPSAISYPRILRRSSVTLRRVTSPRSATREGPARRSVKFQLKTA